MTPDIPYILIHMFVCGRERGRWPTVLGGGNKSFDRLQDGRIPLKRARHFVERQMFQPNLPKKKKLKTQNKRKNTRKRIQIYQKLDKKMDSFRNFFILFTDSSIILCLEQTKGKISWSNSLIQHRDLRNIHKQTRSSLILPAPASYQSFFFFSYSWQKFQERNIRHRNNSTSVC